MNLHSLMETFKIEHRHVIYTLTAVITFALAGVVSNVLRILLDRYFRKTSVSSKLDPTRYAFTKNAVSLVVYVLATVFVFQTIPSLRTLGLTIFASAGLFAAVIGFASQAAFSNIISGIFIVIYKPFRVDDIIIVGKDYEGVVEDITMRHTIIRNYENRRIIIPNTVISAQTITNSSITDAHICLHLLMRISYQSDVEKAKLIMQQEAEQHPLCIDHRTPEDVQNGLPKVGVKLIGLEDYYVQLKAWVWADNPSTAFNLKCDLLSSIKHRFDKEGIIIPYPTQTQYEVPIREYVNN